MKRLLILGWLILATPFVAQVEHAPTVAQCQADQRLWVSKIEEGDREHLPTFDVLGKWGSEMLDCQKVDPANAWSYSNTNGEITAEQATRTLNFLVRNDQYKKFIAEDAAGKR